jgi:ABC-2 type transport system permease protein
VSRSTVALAYRMRLVSTASAAAGLIAVMVVVGALFPAVGHTIGQLKLPRGVAELLGGADYGTITGWFGSEIGSVYGPLVIGGIAVAAAASVTAGEEENRILALVLAHPIRRQRLVAAKGAAVAGVVLTIAFATWIGMILGVAAGGGGIGLRHITAFAVQLAFFGLAGGALALALGAGTGHHALTLGASAAILIAGWLINGFAPLIDTTDWLKYLSLFYYYNGHDPLSNGLDLGGIVVLAALTLLFAAVAIIGVDRRDLRG